jgi:hypothetical protein
MLRYDFDDDLWVLKYDMRNWGIVLRLWISWYVWKWHENYLMLYDAYVYDTMMNMWNDEMSIAWNEIMNAERKTVWVEVPSAQWNVRPFGWKSHRQLKCKISWVKVPLMSTTKQGKRMKGKHDMIYDVFMTRCTNMYVFKWNISYIYISLQLECIEWFMWNFMLYIPIWLWVWMEQNICISLQLDCIW